MKKIFSLSLLINCCALTSYANNLQIGSVTHTESGSDHYLNFTISWNNSWRTSSAPFNWDAVWIFVKRRDCAGLQWHHANLSAQDSAHSGGSTLYVDAYTDKKGVMIYRTANGAGNISNVDIKLKLDSVPAGNYDYQVFGIEMVYIPEGPFYAGDVSSSYSFISWPQQAPFYVRSEAPLSIGQDSGNIFNNAASYLGMIGNTTLDTNFPKGYNAVYCMKYEVSQGQYANFLNSIPQDAAQKRLPPIPPGASRYTISGLWPQMASASPSRACNFLSFQDLTAYLDWAALSPMTELEFEKICRGSNIFPVEREMAWGSNTVTSADSILPGTDGTENESVTDYILPGSGIANYIGNTTIQGVLRCGFAAKANTNRYESGATYYGVMEMSGNTVERCYNLQVRQDGGGIFNGSHGDGELTTPPNSGYANAGWPFEGYVGRGKEAFAVADRGGGYERGTNLLRVSDRSLAARPGEGSTTEIYKGDYGGRGVSRRQQ